VLRLRMKHDWLIFELGILKGIRLGSCPFRTRTEESQTVRIG
jgi:hypothetical protein